MTDKEQAERFKAKAEELECDDDAERFDAMLRKIATAPKEDESSDEG
jgi:hypothetical protein